MNREEAIAVLHEMQPKLTDYRKRLMRGDNVQADVTMDVHWYEAVTVLLLNEVEKLKL